MNTKFQEINMKNMFFVMFSLLLLHVPISSADRGGGGSSFEDGLFWGTDLDRNERIDRDEAKNAFNLAEEEVFNRYDKNQNGSINRVEFFEFVQQAPWTSKFTHPSEQE